MIIKLLQKILYFIINFLLTLKQTFVKVKKYFIKLHIKSAKTNWFISNNFNYYNPVLKTTVFRFGDNWKIVRCNNFFNDEYQSYQEAMDVALQKWINIKEI